MIRSVISFLFLSLSAQASSTPDPEALTALAYQHPSIHQLNWIGRQIAAAMSDSPFKLDEKTTFLYNNPTRAFVIRTTTCDAWALAAAVCANETADPKDSLVVHHEEADAIRHFSLAAHLTCSQGRQVTEVFLAANEGQPSKWKQSSRMDIHNNYQGIFWAADRKKCRPIGLDRRIAKAALKKLYAGELIALKAGKSRCSLSAGPFPGDPISRFGEFRAAVRQIDARCGGETVTSP